MARSRKHLTIIEADATPAIDAPADAAVLPEGSVTVVLRPAEEAPGYDAEAAAARTAAMRRERAAAYVAMRATSERQIQQLLAAFDARGFDIDYGREVVPQSAELLLGALIDEGALDRAELASRQLVIQVLLLNTEFQRRCTGREAALSAPAALALPRGAARRRGRAAALYVPPGARRGGHQD